MSFEMIRATYQAAVPEVAERTVADVVSQAVDRARAKHADWARFEPGVEFLATVFFTDHKRMPLDNYLETLYCAVKHGDFTKDWRKELKKAPEAQPTEAG